MSAFFSLCGTLVLSTGLSWQGTVSCSDHAIGPASPETVTVVVRGLDHTCWKCGGTTTCVVAVHLAGSGQSGDWIWFEDKHALRLARELLIQAGQVGRAATVKDRFSKTANGSYLSNGCEHCDAIQGDWPLGRAISDYALDAPLKELSILATAAVAEAVWRDVKANQDMCRYNYPMTWEDIG